MRLQLPHPSLALLALVVALAAGTATAYAAPQIWSGRTFAFSKAANANVTLPQNQDRITARVWLTRAATKGLYNAEQEAGYSQGLGSLSPLDTEWATGDAVNYSSLTFVDWTDWAGNDPPLTVGVNAVVHLITDDIYVDIRFDSWAIGTPGGGAFSYHRGVPGGATPTEATTWGQLKALYR